MTCLHYSTAWSDEIEDCSRAKEGDERSSERPRQSRINVPHCYMQMPFHF